jgi:hypothetical protein
MMKNIFLLILLFLLGNGNAQESALLDTNDIAARIYSDGSLFNFKFEVPKGSNRNTIFAAGLWIGGYDEVGKLHLAAQEYRSTRIMDYFFGPIASHFIDSSFILKYNRVWKINKLTIDEHKANFNNTGYAVPAIISNWPAHGDVSNGEASTLAPYVDVNGNNVYDPQHGDYPMIRGDQAIFFIFNDANGVHTNAHGENIGIEVLGMGYSFNAPSDSALNQTVFVNYEIMNRSAFNYNNLYLAVYTDIEIGDIFNDIDYVGCDSSLNMSYSYNRTDNDIRYGNKPPAQACVILNYSLSSYMYFNNGTGNPPSATTVPGNSVEYYRYLKSIWRDGTPLTRGGNGYNPGSMEFSRFAFGGNPSGSGWSQLNSGDQVGDKRGLSIVGPLTVSSGETICLDVAFPYARDYAGNNLTSINILKERVKSIRAFYNNQHYDCPVITTNTKEAEKDNHNIFIYPNPSEGVFHMQLNQLRVHQNYQIEIFNAMGTVVYRSKNLTTQESGNFEIDISDHPSGIYFVRIQHGDRVYSEKIIMK